MAINNKQQQQQQQQQKEQTNGFWPKGNWPSSWLEWKGWLVTGDFSIFYVLLDEVMMYTITYYK